MTKKSDSANTNLASMVSDLNGAISDLPTGDFDLTPIPDPISEVPVTGNAELDSKAEINGVLAALRDKNKRNRQQLNNMLDTEYWCCLVFQSRAQKNAFLKALKWFEHGDKYLDGRFCAEKLGVTLPPDVAYFPKLGGHPPPKDIPLIRRVSTMEGGEKK